MIMIRAYLMLVCLGGSIWAAAVLPPPSIATDKNKPSIRRPLPSEIIPTHSAATDKSKPAIRRPLPSEIIPTHSAATDKSKPATRHPLPSEIIASSSVSTEKAKPSPRRLVPDTEVRYVNALQLEQLKLYGQARNIYLDQVKTFLKQADATKSKDTLIPQLPLVMAAAYRLAVVTARDNYYQVHPLVHQLDTFQDTHHALDALIQLVGEMRRQYSHVIPRQLYEPLFFARAYNRVAWGNKLLVATAWKQYVVYPPADIMAMVDLGMGDLEQLLQFQEFPPSLAEWGPDPQSSITDRWLTRWGQSGGKETLLYRVNALSNGEDDPTKLSRLVAKRTIQQIYGTLALYRSPDSQRTLDTARGNYTLERLLSESNRPYFKLMAELVQTIGVL